MTLWMQSIFSDLTSCSGVCGWCLGSTSSKSYPNGRFSWFSRSCQQMSWFIFSALLTISLPHLQSLKSIAKNLKILYRFLTRPNLICRGADKEGNMSGARAISTTPRRELSSSPPPPPCKAWRRTKFGAILTEIGLRTYQHTCTLVLSRVRDPDI